MVSCAVRVLQLLALLVEVMNTHARVAHQAGVLMSEFSRYMGQAQDTAPVKASEIDILLQGYLSASAVLRYLCCVAPPMPHTGTRSPLPFAVWAAWPSAWVAGWLA